MESFSRGFTVGPVLILGLLLAGLVLAAYLVGRNTGLLNFAQSPLVASPAAAPSSGVPSSSPGPTGSQPVNVNPPTKVDFPIGKYCATDQDCKVYGGKGWKCLARLCAISPD